MKNVVGYQKISTKKTELAKNFRRQMTFAEAMVWKELRGNRLNGSHFRRQQVILGYIVDFYCHNYGLIIEIDGKIHDTKQDYDLKREAILKENGFKIIRFKNEEVEQSVDKVLQKILDSMKE